MCQKLSWVLYMESVFFFIFTATQGAIYYFSLFLCVYIFFIFFVMEYTILCMRKLSLRKVNEFAQIQIAGNERVATELG